MSSGDPYIARSTMLGSHKAAVACVKFSPDGLYLASAAVDHHLLIWSTEDNSLAWDFLVHHKIVTVVWIPSDHKPNTRKIACGCNDGNIIIKTWSQSKSEKSFLIMTIRDHAIMSIDCIDYDPINHRLVAAGGPALAIWDLNYGVWHKVAEHRQENPADESADDQPVIRCVKFVDRGRYLIIAYYKHGLYLFGVSPWKKHWAPVFPYKISHLAVARDERFMAIQTVENGLSVHPLRISSSYSEGEALFTTAQFPQAMKKKFVKIGYVFNNVLVSGDSTGQVHLWHVEGGTLGGLKHKGCVQAIDVYCSSSNHKALIATGLATKTRAGVTIWEMRTRASDADTPTIAYNRLCRSSLPMVALAVCLAVFFASSSNGPSETRMEKYQKIEFEKQVDQAQSALQNAVKILWDVIRGQ